MLFEPLNSYSVKIMCIYSLQTYMHTSVHCYCVE